MKAQPKFNEQQIEQAMGFAFLMGKEGLSPTDAEDKCKKYIQEVISYIPQATENPPPESDVEKSVAYYSEETLKDACSDAMSAADRDGTLMFENWWKRNKENYDTIASQFTTQYPAKGYGVEDMEKCWDAAVNHTRDVSSHPPVHPDKQTYINSLK